jgi:hypothetical protein
MKTNLNNINDFFENIDFINKTGAVYELFAKLSKKKSVIL